MTKRTWGATAYCSVAQNKCAYAFINQWSKFITKPPNGLLLLTLVPFPNSWSISWSSRSPHCDQLMFLRPTFCFTVVFNALQNENKKHVWLVVEWLNVMDDQFCFFVVFHCTMHTSTSNHGNALCVEFNLAQTQTHTHSHGTHTQTHTNAPHALTNAHVQQSRHTHAPSKTNINQIYNGFAVEQRQRHTWCVCE